MSLVPSGIVSLLTDFGSEGPFVGIVKGVIAREAAEVKVIDLTHQVPPQDIALAGFWLWGAFRWLARGSVHLCVVDPGVGTDRSVIAVEAQDHYFVAPDNGVLSRVLAEPGIRQVIRVDPKRLGLRAPSRTFHGRDVMAPVAAWIASKKRRLDALGEACSPTLEPVPVPTRTADAIVGRVVAVDRFGNLITDIPGDWLGGLDTEVEIGEHRLRLVGTYQEGDRDECVGLVSSFGTLEIARREGSALETLGQGRGTEVRVRRGGSR